MKHFGIEREKIYILVHFELKFEMFKQINKIIQDKNIKQKEDLKKNKIKYNEMQQWIISIRKIHS